MESLQLTLLALLALIGAGYLWLRHRQHYWQRRRVPHEPRSIYFLARSQHLSHYLQDVYRRFQHCGQPFVGVYMALEPVVLALDLALIKSVFISDFETFPDRGFYHNVHDDPLSGSVVRLQGEPWKRIRAKLTPTFSSGKMKFMFPTVVKVGEEFAQVLTELLGGSRSHSAAATLEMRDLCARFTTDVIGSVAFGIECNSLRNPHTEFRLKGDMAFRCLNELVEVWGAKYPQLLRRLHVKVFSRELIDFYSRIVKENVEYRERQQVRRNDFLDLLIELKNNKAAGDGAPLNLGEITAQAFVFFIGGFETTSSTMTFCLYELSKNPEVQSKARANVLEALAKHNNELSYECLNEMHYLKQVVLETLRKHPVAPTLRRIARKDYAVPGTAHTIPAGMQVLIPVYAIHRDPAYYPDPDTFDPERFTPQQQQQRQPMSYAPFGAGPRNCLAERFGKMQTMIGLAALLRHFRFSCCASTPPTLPFDNRNLRIFSLKGGLQLKVEKVGCKSDQLEHSDAAKKYISRISG